MRIDFLQVPLCRFVQGDTRHCRSQRLWYFIRSISWSAEICWYCMRIVTAAILVITQGTGTGAPALRANPAEACNQAFWYGLVQSDPVECKHRWRPVIHIHQWVRHGQNVASLMVLNLSRATKIIISKFVQSDLHPQKNKSSLFNH